MEKIHYDYIVVGTGPSGAAISSRLSESGKYSVLVLEAGGPDNHPFIHMPAGFAKLTGERANWGYETIPQKGMKDRVFWYPQGKILGGSSSINAMVYTRGNPKDYEDWKAMGCDGWGYSDVMHYFRKLENNEVFNNEYHGNDGPVTISNQISPHPMCKVFLRAAQEKSIPYNPDFNGKEQFGCGIYQVFQRNGKRCHSVRAYIHEARKRPNYTLKLNSHVSKVLIEKEKVEGIEYIHQGKKYKALAEKEVILCSGPIGSPKILMLSGIGDAEELRKVDVEVKHHLPGVGKNFHDHLDLFTVYQCTGPYSYDKHTQLGKTLWAGFQYVLFNNGPVTSNLAEAGGFAYADSSARSPDIQFHLMIGSGIEYGLDKMEGYGLTLNSCFVRPESRGYIKLRDNDPFTKPLINPNYWGTDRDKKLSIEGLRLAREIMSSDAFKAYLSKEILPGEKSQTDEELAEYAIKYSKTDYHSCGACKMGKDELAVVSPTLKVHGLEKIRVCDSSIMPNVISSNTNAVSYMIGEKAADLILADSEA